MPDLDLLTILSTDWVESTATRVRIGEERADCLQRIHDDLVREAVADARGIVVKGSGDGVLATFDSATDALKAAVGVQQRLEAYSRRADAIATVEARAGISVGDIIHQDGDIFGTPVVEAVRLCSAAGPGEILCSDVVRHLARGRGGFDFDVVGLLELKGLPEPVATCVVRWEGLGPGRARIELPPELVLATPKRFVGRHVEVSELLSLFRSADRAHAMWLFGEPGIGKTRLATELAARAAAAGATVLFGRCDEDTGAPFQPFQQALRWYVGHLDDAGLVGALGADPEPLARLLPELASRAPELAGAALAASETQQFRLFEAVRLWLAQVSVDGGLVLVVDDVHWADRPTRSLLAHLVRTAEPTQLLVIATARDTDPDRSDDLDHLVDDLERTGRSRRVRLGGLDVDDIAALLDAEAGSGRCDDVAARLAVETGGNPLYLGALLAAGRGGDRAEVGRGDVRAAVRLRTRRLPEPVAEVLTAAAVAGVEFDLGTVLRATGVDEDDGLVRVEHAVRAGLVEELGVDRFRFTHGLVRDVLADDLSASRRARLHGAIATAIESSGPFAVEDSLRALAHHHARAGDAPAHRSAAMEYAVRAGRKAVETLAFDLGVEDFAFALELLAGGGIDGVHDRFDVLLEKGVAERLAALHPAARATLREAAALARSRGDARALAVAAIEFEETNWRPGEPGEEARRLLEAVQLLADAQTASNPLDAALQIRLQSSLARAMYFDGDDSGHRHADDALARARLLGDPGLLAHCLEAAIQVRALMADEDAAVVRGFADELWSLGDQLDDVEPLGMGCQYGFSSSLSAGDRDAAEEWLVRGADLAARLGSRFMRVVQLTDEFFLAFIDGRLEDAERVAGEEVALADRCGIDITAGYGLQMFLIRREQDRLRELAPAVRLLIDSADRGRLWGPGLVLLLAELGMAEEARVELARLSADRFAAVPRDVMLPLTLTMAADAAHQLGEPGPAADIIDLLRPWAGQAAGLGHSSTMGSTNRHIALMAELLGQLDEADARLEDAVTFDRRLRAPLFEAASLADWARVRLRRGDHAGAIARAEEAARLAEKYGLARTARRVSELGLI